MARRLVLRAGPPVLAFVLVCVVWQLAIVAWEVPAFSVPGPLDVARALGSGAGKLSRAAGITLLAAVSGFLLSLVTGTLVAFAFSQSRIVRSSFYPYAIFLQTVPIVAIAPLIVLWFGYGFRSVVIVAFIISLFPIITNGTAGMLAVDPDLNDLFRLHRASRLQTWLKLRLPSAVPYLLAGARTSSGLAVVGAIVGEFVAGHDGTSYGLGYLIQQGQAWSRTADMFAAIVPSTLLGLTIFGVVNVLSATILNRWFDA